MPIFVFFVFLIKNDSLAHSSSAAYNKSYIICMYNVDKFVCFVISLHWHRYIVRLTELARMEDLHFRRTAEAREPSRLAQLSNEYSRLDPSVLSDREILRLYAVPFHNNCAQLYKARGGKVSLVTCCNLRVTIFFTKATFFCTNEMQTKIEAETSAWVINPVTQYVTLTMRLRCLRSQSFCAETPTL